ncbi:polysaccharide lyase [Planctomycetota bacterium]
MLAVYILSVGSALGDIPKQTTSGTLEAQLKGRSDILYFSDFENEDWHHGWTASNESDNAKNLRLVNMGTEGPIKSFEGKALEVTIQKGSHYGIDTKFDFKEHLGVYPEEMYARYYCCYADSMPGYHGKSPGWSGTEAAGWGGKVSDGTNGWSARATLKGQGSDKIRMMYYTYHADMKGKWGDEYNWSGPGASLEPNRWYCIEQYCKINTPGMKDGILRAWVDGELVLEKTDVKMRTVDTLHLKAFWLNYYHGGSSVSSKTRHVYLDNLAFSTEKRIGAYSPPTPVLE